METATIQARLAHPAFAVEGAMDALQALGKAVTRTRLDPKLLELMNIRASQINGCGVCVLQHPKIARKLGETDDRILAVAGWRDAPFYTDAERAALALTEAGTRMSDQGEPVSGEVWDDAARHFDEQELAGLVLAIANINVWNRLNVMTKQVAGIEW